jgi:hypothetical protein
MNIAIIALTQYNYSLFKGCSVHRKSREEFSGLEILREQLDLDQISKIKNNLIS